jgi:hypothetical protein
VCTLLLTAGVVACDGQEPATEPPASREPAPGSATGARPELCEDVAALRASVGDLVSVPVGRDAVPTLQDELADISADLKTMRASASEEYAGEVDALSAQVAALRTSLREATGDPSAATLAQVTQNVGAVGAAMRDLSAAVADTC